MNSASYNTSCNDEMRWGEDGDGAGDEDDHDDDDLDVALFFMYNCGVKHPTTLY